MSATNRIPISKLKILYILFLLNENSSTIISVVAMYRKVPTERLRNIPSIKGLSEPTMSPMQIPIGVNSESGIIKNIEVFNSELDFCKLMPIVKTSAHLCEVIAIIKLSVPSKELWRPREIPPRMEWKERLLIKIICKYVILPFDPLCLHFFSCASSN